MGARRLIKCRRDDTASMLATSPPPLREPLGTVGAGQRLLRARATRHGLKLYNATPSDLTASVIGAHIWLATLHLSSLDHAPGVAAGKALAALYVRAAGQAGITPVSETIAIDLSAVADRELPERDLGEISPALHWLSTLPAGRAGILAAAVDLADGADNPALAAASTALLNHADSLVVACA